MTRQRLTCWVCWALVAIAATVVLAPQLAQAGPLDAAQKSLKAGDFAKAATGFRKALKKGKSRDAALGLAEAATRGKLDDDNLFEAEEALGAVLETNEHDWDATLLIAEVYLLKASRQRNAQLLRGYYEDAREHFGRALAKKSDCEQAAVGMVQALYSMGDFTGAEDAIDKFLDRKPANAARAWYWKGQVIYIQAGDAYRKAGKLSEPVKKLYVEAKNAYAQSTTLDAGNYDAWMQLAYAAQWSHDQETAHLAYVSAIKADTKMEQHLPLKGLLALHQHEPARMTETLTALQKDFPKHEQVVLYALFDHFKAERFPKAKELAIALAKIAKNPAQAHFYSGQIAEKEDNKDAAAAAYKKALAANKNYEDAAVKWAGLYLNRGNFQSLIQTSTKAQLLDLVAKLQAVFKAAPTAVSPRNDLAFLLREVYVSKGQSSAYEPFLKLSTTTYQSATDIIGEYDPSYVQKYGYWLRYNRAQVVSDTALMYQFYAPTKDWKRAEKLYLRALEWSDNGYFDSWNNLRSLYTKQERWEDLYDLASLCADNLVKLKNWKPVPNEEARAQARGVMKGLLDSGKVEDN